MTDMKITAQRGTAFYLRSAKNFLEGVEAKDGSKKEAVDRLTLSGLGAAMSTVAAVACALESEGVATIAGIQTQYLDLESGGVSRGAAQLVVHLERSGAAPAKKPEPKPEAVAEAKPQLASIEELRGLSGPLVLDVRDPNEVEAGKGGPPKAIPGSRNVPLNVDGLPQSQRTTTPEEFEARLQAAAVLPEDKATPIVVHCGGGGRAAKAQKVLQGLGYGCVLNGGSTQRIAEAWYIGLGLVAATAGELKGLENPLVLDLRDPAEVAGGSGGPPAAIPGSANVPLNCDGRLQDERPTTPAEFEARLRAAGVLPEDKARPIVVHCAKGLRAAKAEAVLRGLGHTAVLNGVSAAHLAEALGLPSS